MAISTIDNNGANLGQLGNRNLIINGAMQVAQRATSVTGQTGSAVLTVDRFQGHSSGATFNMSQQAVTLGGESGLPIQFTKFLRYNATTGANNCGVWQAVEDVTRVQGTHTLSFYAKGTNPAGGAISLDIRQYFGSGGSSELDDDTRTFSVTSTWQRFTFTTTPTVAGKTIGTSSYYRPFFKQPSSDNGSAAWTLDITGVQLEVGDTATPFEHRSYGEELAKCQRYYQIIQCKDTNGNVALIRNRATHNEYSGTVYSMSKMRTEPSMSSIGMDRLHKPGITYDTVSGVSFNSHPDGTSARVNLVPGADHTNCLMGWFGAVSGGSINFDAEL